MRKAYIYDHPFYSSDATLVIERDTDDEHRIQMTRNTKYQFNCEPGEFYEVFKAGQVDVMDAWLAGDDVDSLRDVECSLQEQLSLRPRSITQPNKGEKQC